MWPPNLLPSIGFLSLATYISNYSDGRKEGRKNLKEREKGNKEKKETGRKGERKEGRTERKGREEVKEAGRGSRRDRKRGRT